MLHPIFATDHHEQTTLVRGFRQRNKLAEIIK